MPDQVIAWRSIAGARNEGTVRFQPLGQDKTRIELELHWEPEGVIERVGDVLGADDLRVQGDLNRFKEFVESRGAATGAWRGKIEGERVEEDQEAGSSPRG